MKTIITIALCFFLLHTKITGQEIKHAFNLIISIDNEIVTGNLSNLKINVKLKTGNHIFIESEYYPGNLSITKKNYDFLKSADVDKIFFTFNYTRFCKKTRKDLNYDIEINQDWLDNYFYVLKIYNTNNPNFSKIFYPLKGKKYTFEINSPNGSITRIRKKHLSDCF